MEFENYHQDSSNSQSESENESEKSNLRSEEASREKKLKKHKKSKKEKKEKKHKKQKKQKKHKKEKKQKKSKRDKKDRRYRGEDGSAPSCSKNEVNENIDLSKDGRVSSSSEKEVNGNKYVRKDSRVSSSSEKEVNGNKYVRKYNRISSSSEKEDNRNIDDLSPKSDAYCSCIRNHNEETKYVCSLCRIPTPKSSDDVDDNQNVDFFQQMDNFNNNDKIYDRNNTPLASISEMQLVLNKFRPYLSSPAEDEPNLMKRLKDLGVEGVDDLKFLNFETDLLGIMKVIQCRKLKLELSKDVTMHESINTQSEIHKASSLTVEHKRTPLTQPTPVLNIKMPQSEDVTMCESVDTQSEIHEASFSTVEQKRSPLTQPSSIFNFTIPQFKESVRKSLENGNVSKIDRLYIVKTMSGPMLDVTRNLGTKECRQVAKMLKEQFPNAFKNKDSGFSVEYVTKKLMRRANYLKIKKQQGLKQKCSQLQIYRTVSKITHQKTIKYGIHPERYALAYPIVGRNKNFLENIKTVLKFMHILRHKKTLKWTLVTRLMNMTYFYQRQFIVHSKCVGNILLDWPFVGEEEYMRSHFHYLTNTEETVLNNFYKRIPTMFKFVQAEAERKLKKNDMQIKLIAIIKNNSNKNAYNEFLTVLLCYMAIMKENAEHMFTVMKDENILCNAVLGLKLNSIPVVACLGDIWSNPLCFVFVGNECLWSEPLEIQKAIEIMFMSYYVFNLQYPRELTGTLQFLQSYMFNIKNESNNVEQCVPKLSKLMNNYEKYMKKVEDGVAEHTTVSDVTHTVAGLNPDHWQHSSLDRQLDLDDKTAISQSGIAEIYGCPNRNSD